MALPLRRLLVIVIAAPLTQDHLINISIPGNVLPQENLIVLLIVNYLSHCPQTPLVEFLELILMRYGLLDLSDMSFVILNLKGFVSMECSFSLFSRRRRGLLLLEVDPVSLPF
jgi:hypothetical protein